MTPESIKKIVDKIRKEAEPMDLIFLGSNDLVGKLIRLGQDNQTIDNKPSLWSHVCLYFDKNLIIESTLGFDKYKNFSRWINGTQIYPLEYRIEGSDYNCSLVKFTNLKNKDREKLKDVAERIFVEGKTYPILGLIGSLLTYKIFHKWKNNPLDNEKRSVYCSAFCAEVYSHIGIKFSDKYDIDNISPQLLWNGCLKHSVEVINLSREGKLVF